MRALILTHPGLEKTAISEAQKIAKVHEAKILSQGAINLIVESEQDLAELCYRGRTFLRVILVLKNYKIEDLPSEDLLPELSEYLEESATTECEREGEHSFTSFDVEKTVNKIITKKYKVKIDHKNPQTKIFVHIKNDKCTIGIDFAGYDLGRRDYRIFLGRESLKGTVAAGLLHFAGYAPGQVLADPFCKQGIIPIEAALIAKNISPHKYTREKLAFNKLPRREFKTKEKETEFKGKIYCTDENFKNVSAAKKNAKIAGVAKELQFSRTTIDWLDMKIERADRIVTFPVQPSRQTSQKKIEKTYELLFERAKKILPEGKLCICVKRGQDLIKQKAKKHFEIEKEQKVMQGKEELMFLLYKCRS